ncbi:tetratricopeptide repeat protein [Rickettsia tamurae]|uniref:tetratricopeptide repeat protein n=1 Tax=Rickettsia tamurae TaxID=334545 RepID=UPI001F4381A3|nr:tetratricopeptide repeat protein [Rickettsia tamurae]
MAYQSLGDIPKGLKYQKAALKMLQIVNQNNYHNIAIFLNNIGRSYRGLGNISKGLKYLEEALKILRN